jgi:hypothetical protein
MDKYNIKIIGDKVYVVKGVLFYAGNIVDFKTEKEGITEVTIEETGCPLETKITVEPEEVFYDLGVALDFRIDRCKDRIKRLKEESDLVESHLLTTRNRRQKIK